MRLLALSLLGATLVVAVGCGASEVSNADQATKMRALHQAEQESRAKDGVKSE